MGNLSSTNNDQYQDGPTSQLSVPLDFKKPVRITLQPLLNWSLAEIREIFAPFKQRKSSPLLTRSQFFRFIRQSRVMSFHLYDQMCKKDMINVFQIVSILTMCAYTTYTYKIQFLFNVFDLDCSRGLQFKELILTFKSLMRGYSVLTDQPIPHDDLLEKYALSMFSKADLNNDQCLQLGEILGWFEGNTDGIHLFERFEPELIGKEEYHIFNSFKPAYSESQETLLYSRINKEHQRQKLLDQDFLPLNSPQCQVSSLIHQQSGWSDGKSAIANYPSLNAIKNDLIPGKSASRKKNSSKNSNNSNNRSHSSIQLKQLKNSSILQQQKHHHTNSSYLQSQAQPNSPPTLLQQQNKNQSSKKVGFSNFNNFQKNANTSSKVTITSAARNMHLSASHTPLTHNLQPPKHQPSNKQFPTPTAKQSKLKSSLLFDKQQAYGQQNNKQNKNDHGKLDRNTPISSIRLSKHSNRAVGQQSNQNIPASNKSILPSLKKTASIAMPSNNDQADTLNAAHNNKKRNDSRLGLGLTRLNNNSSTSATGSNGDKGVRKRSGMKAMTLLWKQTKMNLASEKNDLLGLDYEEEYDIVGGMGSTAISNPRLQEEVGAEGSNSNSSNNGSDLTACILTLKNMNNDRGQYRTVQNSYRSNDSHISAIANTNTSTNSNTKRKFKSSTSYKKKFSNMIILKGRTITKKEVFQLREYFENISGGKPEISIESFIQAFSDEKYNHMKSVAASLFTFLDKNHNGKVCFKEMITNLYPDLQSDHFRIITKWNTEYSQCFNLQTKIKANREHEELKKRVLPKTCLIRYKQIFNFFDREHKGYVDLADLKHVLGEVSTEKELEDTLKSNDKDGDGRLTMKEFVHILLPLDLEIQGLVG